MSLMRRLAEFVAQAEAADLPALDRDILRRHATDVAIARVLGGMCDEGRKLRQVFGPALDSEGIAGIAGLARMTEMDDIHTGANTTPSSVTVPVAFCLYPESARDPRQLENAIYVGTDLLVRFGKAMDGARALFNGFWPTRSGATLGACATASRLLGLTLDQTEHALSFAVMTTAGRSGRFFSDASGRWIVFANAVATGIRMAYAARAGFRSAEIPPDGAWIAAALGLEFSADHLTDDLGRRSIFPELAMKPYATARQALGATEAMRRLIADGLDPSSVQRVIVHVPTSHKGMVSQKLDPHVRGSAFVSAAAQIATAALAPDALYDVERRDVLADPRFMAFASRVEIVGDPALDQGFPEIWAAEVEVVTHGETYRQPISNALGSPDNRMTDADVLEKGRKALAWFGQENRADEIVGLGRDIFRDAVATARVADIFAQG
jgi:2-methylcitrate dehydratase PrpD